jgi:hypothetical protein
MVIPTEKTIARIINPIVKGSFRNLVLINAKPAERIIRMVIILKMLIIIFGELRHAENTANGGNHQFSNSFGLVGSYIHPSKLSPK